MKRKQKQLLSKIMIVCLALLTTFLLIAGCAKPPAPEPTPKPAPAPTPSKVIQLKIAHIGGKQNEVHYEAFKKEVEEKTNGQVQITLYHRGALGDLKTHWDMLISGTIDISMLNTINFPGKYPLFDMFTLPFINSDIKTHTLAMEQLAQRGLLDKVYYDEIHHVVAGSAVGASVLTKGTRVRVPSDLKGVRTSGGGGIMTKAAELTGAASVTVPFPEMYNALEKGIIEAAFSNYTIVATLKLDEFIRYALEMHTSRAALVTVMNKKSYANLPGNIQKIFDEAATNSLQPLFDIINSEFMRGKDLLIAKKAEIREPTPAELQIWRDTFKPLWDDWLKTTESKGLPGKQLLHEYGVIVKKLGGEWPYEY